MSKLPRKIAAAAAMFSATLNLNGCVYGPPPDDGSQIDIPYGYQSEEVFRPEDNANVCVYGPPSYFGMTDEAAEETAEPITQANGDITNE